MWYRVPTPAAPHPSIPIVLLARTVWAYNSPYLLFVICYLLFVRHTVDILSSLLGLCHPRN